MEEVEFTKNINANVVGLFFWLRITQIEFWNLTLDLFLPMLNLLNLVMSKIAINIPKPCNQSWNQMSAVEKGRFCNSCQKTVYDFTKLSNRAIVEKIQSEPTSCGRFLNEQLNHNLISNKKSIFWKTGVASLLSFLSSGTNKIQAQQKPDTIQTIKNEDFIDKAILIPYRNLKISGIVTDDQIPFPFVNVTLNRTTTITQTDFEGKFEMMAKENDTLVFSFLGYEEYKITVKKSETLKVNMRLDPNMALMGEAVVVTRKRSFIGRLFYSIGRIFQ